MSFLIALQEFAGRCRRTPGRRPALGASLGAALLLLGGAAGAQPQGSRAGTTIDPVDARVITLGEQVVIDGELKDMIDFAGSISVPANGCAFVDQDPAMDIRIFDPKIVSCATIVDNYYVNGFDQVLDVVAYDRTAQVLYLGIRVAGVIGDPDGNGDPDTKCPQATFDDQPGIGFDDSYKWELNSDCAGAPEITIEVRNNLLTVTGATFSNKTYAFNGSDLEVAVEDIVLPPAYAVRIFAGNIADGLGEDLHQLTCNPPGPQITVDKTANPERICPGANTTFTIVVSNPGVVPMQTVSLVDALPAGLTYVNGSSNSNCGVGQPNVNGQQLTWPNLALAPGASCTITFQATAGAQCLGPQVNSATATGSFSTPCFQGGEPQTVQDSDDATVTCAPLPCVDVTELNASASACANGPVAITGSVQNCGSEAATIVVTLNGGAPQNLGSVAAGGSANFSFQATMGECTPGQNVTFTVVATATNECGEDTDSDSRNVRCDAPPCVNITEMSAPAEACPNAKIKISGLVQNCSLDPETIVVVLNGGAPQNLGVVQPGASVAFSFTVETGNCTAGQQLAYTVVATATNSCGEATDTESRNVRCKALPCVNLSALEGPASACANAAVVISGSVTNCSLDPETIAVSLNGGAPQNLGVVAAGASANFSFNTTMGECTAGQNVTFTVVATAVNDCGQATDTETKDVLCKLGPCVEVTVRVPEAACPNTAIEVAVAARNCGSDPETITVALNGGAPQNLGVVQPGQTSNYTFNVNTGECQAGQNLAYTVVATASNDCGQTTDQETGNVRCRPLPCVEITSLSGPPSACTGVAITITGTVQNCSSEAETIVVALNGGAPQNLGSVPAGGSANFSFQTTQGSCTNGQSVTYTVVATATNDCGSASDTDAVQVACGEGPCVDVKLRGPGSACVGATIRLEAKASNCGETPAEITITLGGQSQNMGVVAPGQMVTAYFDVVVTSCVNGVATFQVTATATNSCGSTSATDNENVLCTAQPCVEITSFHCPTSGCHAPNSDVTISGTVRNCSTAPETIVVTLNGGTPQNLGVVAAGATADFSFTANMGQCTPGQNVPFSVVATATNECGTVTDTESCNVKCGTLPCVEIKLKGPEAACKGTTIQLRATVANCSEGPEEVCVIIGGTTRNLGVLQPGEEKVTYFDYLLDSCYNGSKIIRATAKATNACGTVEVQDSETVLCSNPRIDVEKTAESQVSNASIIHYCITVRNPGSVALANVKVTDDLCSSAKYHGNAVPAPASAPNIGSSGVIVWNIDALAPGETKTLRFEAKAQIDCGSVGPCDRHCDGNNDGRCDRCSSSTSVRCGGCDRHCDGNYDGRCDRCGSSCSVRCGSSSMPCNSHCDGNSDNRCDRCNSYCTTRCGGCDRHCDGNYDNRCDRCGSYCTVRCSSNECSQCNNTVLCTNKVCAIGECAGSNGLSKVRDDDEFCTRITCAGGPGCGYDRITETPSLTTTPALDALNGVELYRALPNPFSASTSFTYEVTGDAATVEIGVYDVAGRTVTRLVNETKSAGRYSVAWDGRSDAGVRVSRGIYFIRTNIGGAKTNLQRVVYVQ